MDKSNKIAISSVISVLLVVLFVTFCTTKINAGNGGVVYSMSGGVEEKQ